MTNLIVALDGPKPIELMEKLYFAGVRWFKVGPLTLLNVNVHSIPWYARKLGLSLFYDDKTADHGPYVVSELAKRLAGVGYVALSTATDQATEYALRGARGTGLKVWKHVAPTSLVHNESWVIASAMMAHAQGAHGVICGAQHAAAISWHNPGLDIVCPGITMDIGESGGHVETWGPTAAAREGATHVVVGRPIWTAADPVAAAQRYLEALR